MILRNIKLMPGDLFATENPHLLGRAINAIQRLWSSDNAAEYSHSGIILSGDGETFEALWTLTKAHLDAYKEKRIIIVRCDSVSQQEKETILNQLVAQHSGQWYPLWRLFLHIIPPFAKVSIIKRPVCSELTAKYLALLGVRHGQWAGTNPDTLADEWRRWREFTVLFEGKWSGEIIAPIS